MHPMDVFHQYQRVYKQREKRRKGDKGLGTYVLCPGSLAPGVGPHVLQLFIRTTSKTKKPFASCDGCGLWIRFWSCIWEPGGQWFGLSQSEAEALLLTLAPILGRGRQQAQDFTK
jgi:hypothetical protein